MAVIKSFTDLEQSKKLAEILPLESADMCYLPTHIGDEHHFIASLSPYSVCTKMTDVSIEYCTPCWSLSALLGALPKEIVYNKHIVFLEFHGWENSLEYINNADYTLYVTSSYDNPVDACVTMIEKLHELKML